MVSLTDVKCPKCLKKLLKIDQYTDFTYSEKELILYCVKCEKKKPLQLASKVGTKKKYLNQIIPNKGELINESKV